MSLKPIYHIHKRMEGDQKWSNGEVITEVPDHLHTEMPLWQYVRSRAAATAQETNVAEVEVRQVILIMRKETVVTEEAFTG